MTEDFRAAAREVMRSRRLTQHALASQLNYTDAYLSRILSGKQRPSEQIMRAMDEHFGTSLVPTASPLTPDDRARVAHSVRHPQRVDDGTVRALANALAAQRRLDDVLGSEAVLAGAGAQFDRIRGLVKSARGPHRRPLLAVAAEWAQFSGWLHASLRHDESAIDLFSRSEELADEADDATVGAVAVSFKGYVARQQGRPRGVVRAAQAALSTPGAHPTQATFDTIQAAQGYAAMGMDSEAGKLLDEATKMADRSIAPPALLYWYTPAFFRATIGLTHSQMGNHREAVGLLRAGLGGMPDDQRASEWAAEYRSALEISASR